MPEYVSLECLAARLRLPKKYLRKLATIGDIPSLQVGRWLRFDETSVRAALRHLANKGPAKSNAVGGPGR